MKFIHYIFAASAMIAMASCTKEGPTYTVGEADNAIVLSARIADESGSVLTKAGSEDNHASHRLPTQGTKMRLQVIGEWWRTQGASSGDQIVKTSVGTAGSDVVSVSHRKLGLSPDLYWDDYGTADPSNMLTSRGRDKGLTVYGVAVDGLSTLPSEITGLSESTAWTTISWSVPTDQSTSGWTDNDLLISNNVKNGGADGCYRFDDRSAGKLLEFRHAMSKITVRLVANEGFPTSGVGATTNKFAASPSVELTTAESTEWAYTAGNVNITDGTVTSQSDLSNVKMHTDKTDDAVYTVILDALVCPGSVFPAGKTIAKVTADGNIYYVSSDKIRAKMLSLDPSTDYTTKPGVNYVLTVLVNKTKIDNIEATITDWSSVEADQVAPTVNVSASYGKTDTGTFPTAFTAFSFYRSTSMDSGYSMDATVTKGTPWTFDNAIYWPTHNTHYQFRGVWPQTDDTGNTATLPAVTIVNDKQVIAVSNVKYEAGTFPSDLSIARPEFANGSSDLCKSTDHTPVSLLDNGICATEGTINLNFRYMMSKVEVRLSTAAGTPPEVNLSGAKVELVNAYTTGNVALGSREATVTGSAGTYELHADPNNADYRLDAIVPQTLTYTPAGAATNLRFKVTIYSTSDSAAIDDIYYADVNPILETGTSTKVAPDGKWEAGKHYVYNLALSKTEIKATATITDWETVTASENVWF